MRQNIDEIIKELLAIPRIAQKVDENNLTREQVIEALPILIDMSEEKDDENTKFLTSFIVTHDGSIQKTTERSTQGKQFAYLDYIVSSNYVNVDFEANKEFLKEPTRKNLVEKLDKYFSGTVDKPKGLYIYGKMGIGKTFICKRIAKKVAEQKKTVVFMTTSELASLLKDTFGNSTSGTNESYNDRINLLKRADYLFLDDIGAEPITTWFRDEVLFSILNERMQNNRTTFFTSNFSMNELERIQSRTSKDKYAQKDRSQRLMERIRSLAEEVELTGVNKRFQ